jgi:hypothetical protein
MTEMTPAEDNVDSDANEQDEDVLFTDSYIRDAASGTDSDSASGTDSDSTSDFDDPGWVHSKRDPDLDDGPMDDDERSSMLLGAIARQSAGTDQPEPDWALGPTERPLDEGSDDDGNDAGSLAPPSTWICVLCRSPILHNDEDAIPVVHDDDPQPCGCRYHGACVLKITSSRIECWCRREAELLRLPSGA